MIPVSMGRCAGALGVLTVLAIPSAGAQQPTFTPDPAVEPARIAPSEPTPADFDGFWAAKLRLLAEVPVHPLVKQGRSDRAGVEWSTVRLGNVGRRTAEWLDAIVHGREPLSSGATSRTPQPIFFDDFSGDSLDRAKWTVRVTGRTVNEEQQAYVDDTSTIRVVRGPLAGGAADALLIRGRWRPGHRTPEGNRFDFVSGRMDSRGKVEFTYGTAAARMRLPAGAGLWPAFWLLGVGRWPDVGEIDVMENVGDPSWVSAAVHGPGYSGDTPLVKRATLPPGQDITGWHVYAVEWTPDEMIFRVDDREIYRVTKAMVAPYGRWAFDNPKFIILNLALGGGYPRSVNGAKTPYVGLPDSTVQLIQRDSAAVLVDWVRVTPAASR